MGTGIRRRAVATAAVALSVLAAWVPSAPVAAATTVSVWIQTLDACNQTIGGVGLMMAQAPAWTLFALVGGAMVVFGLSTAGSVAFVRWGK